MPEQRVTLSSRAIGKKPKTQTKAREREKAPVSERERRVARQGKITTG